MSLPILDTPKYILKLPSTGENIEYRPFLVKEEKNMMIAQETGDDRVLTKAMLDLVNVCTFGVCTPEKITTFDLEYIFLNLRIKSVGETTDIKLKCEKCEDHDFPVTIDLTKIVPSAAKKNIKKKVMLNDKVGVTLQWIKASKLNEMADSSEDQTEMMLDGIAAMIESIFDEKKVYPAAESSPKELREFIGSFSRANLEEIQKFAESAPTVSLEVETECDKCKCKHKQTLSGISSFF